ncbi:MAG: lipopolysaccharide biosynthesis protein [Gemmatirosa sp.]
MRRLAGNPILRSMGGVGGAAALAQGLGLLAAPIASRLFSEEAFGQFGVFFALANVLVTLALLGMTDALLAARRDDDADALLGASLRLLLVMPLLLALVTAVLVWRDWFGYGALPVWAAPLMAVQVAVVSAAMIVQMWLIRRRRFRRIAIGHLSQGGARAAGQVAFGLAGLGFLGLALSDLVCRVAVVAVSLPEMRDDLRRAWRRPVRAVVRAAWSYRLFPLFRTPSTFANNFGTALPPTLIAMGYGVSAAGLYTLMNGVLVAPIALVQKAVGDVFIGHFAAEHRRDPVAARRFLMRVAGALAALALAMGALVYAVAEPGFALLFGERWREAGRLAILMLPALMADLAIGPLGSALNVVNRPDAKLGFDVARIGGYLGAYALARAGGLPLDGLVLLLGRFGLASYLVYAALIWYGTRHPRPVADDPDGAAPTVSPVPERDVTGDLPAISG